MTTERIQGLGSILLEIAAETGFTVEEIFAAAAHVKNACDETLRDDSDSAPISREDELSRAISWIIRIGKHSLAETSRAVANVLENLHIEENEVYEFFPCGCHISSHSSSSCRECAPELSQA